MTPKPPDTAVDAAIDEILDSFNPFDTSFNDFIRKKPLAKAKLKALMVEAPQPSERLCHNCGNRTFWYDGAYRCIYDGVWGEGV